MARDIPDVLHDIELLVSFRLEPEKLFGTKKAVENLVETIRNDYTNNHYKKILDYISNRTTGILGLIEHAQSSHNTDLEGIKSGVEKYLNEVESIVKQKIKQNSTQS